MHGFAQLKRERKWLARTKVSEPTVVRFCRRLGYEGFKDLKLQIIQELAYRQATQEKCSKTAQASPPPSHASTSTEGVGNTVYRGRGRLPSSGARQASLDWPAVEASARAHRRSPVEWSFTEWAAAPR